MAVVPTYGYIHVVTNVTIVIVASGSSQYIAKVGTHGHI